MGQYFKIANLDKQEYLDPFDFGGGWKLFEGWDEVISNLLTLLTSVNKEGASTYFGQVIGRWAGDRIVIIGDYDSSGLYNQLKNAPYRKISPMTCTGWVYLDWADSNWAIYWETYIAAEHEYTWDYENPGDG